MRIDRMSVCWVDHRDSYKPNELSRRNPGKVAIGAINKVVFTRTGKVSRARRQVVRCCF